MSEYLERTDANKPTFGDYVTLEMKCYGVPNEHFIHEVLSSPFISNSWRNVPIDARDPEEHLHDAFETVVAVRTQGVNPRDAHIFAVRLADVLPMKGDKWAWQESPLRTRIAELEAAQRWIRTKVKLPDRAVRQFYEVVCLHQDFAELALFSKGRWIIYDGTSVYDITDRVVFWRRRQPLPAEVMDVLNKRQELQ